jgi:predicted dehydrogenase
MSLNVGILGCGNHANTHAATVKESSFAQLIACADVDSVRARIFAEKYGVNNNYGSLKEMVDNHKLDLLIIVAFPTVHLPLINEAVSYGIKAIICEKPFALNAEQASSILALAKQSDTFIVEGLMYRSHPQIQKAKELISSGAIGDVRYIHTHFCDFANADPANWRNHRNLAGGSMTAKGCYLVDASNLFSDSRAKAAFCTETIDPHYDVEIGKTGTILYENGVTAQFETNHRSSWREEFKITGTKGSLVIPHAIMTLYQKRKIELQFEQGVYLPTIIETVEFDECSSTALQLENVYRCIREGASPNATLEDSLINYKVTDALMKSSQTGMLEPIVWNE